MAASALSQLCDLLDTYKGRDKVLRTLCYSAKLAGGLSRDAERARRLLVFSAQMSGARAVLRLLDDLPMLKYTLDYGLGGSEPDRLMAALGVATNAIDQLYYPIEKMAWLAEHGLVSADGGPWDVASSVCWVASIYLTLAKSLRLYAVLGAQPGLRAQRRAQLLTCLRLSLDLVHAVNTLPRGFLWSARLNTWQVGLVATVSSLLGLYQMCARRSRN